MSELVLVVEDDRDLRDILEFNLGQAGYRTIAVSAGRPAIDAARVETPDLVILDLMLPDISGIDVCRALRREDSTREVPIVMLTARHEEIDRVVGFEVGADDYVAKPFSIRELLLRVRAVLRRAQPPAAPSATLLRHGPIRLDLESRRAYVDEGEVSLTVIEFELMKTLIERRGRVQSRTQLLTDVWRLSPDVESRTVDTHVKRLRQKLGQAAALIETVRGVGYRLIDAAEPS
jgi:two-component system phosphate regulon response regulator PhoB